MLPDIKFFTTELPLAKDLYQTLEPYLSEEQKSFGEKRKHEFLGGRYCVNKALSDLGVDIAHKILPTTSESRAPKWPDGVCGSISHSKSMALAVVSKEYLSLGVDIELFISLERLERIKSRFITPAEESLTNIDKLRNSTIIFSAKEALFKLINPLCHKYFGFHDAKVNWIEESSFEIVLESEIDSVKVYNGSYQGIIFEIDGGIGTLLSLKK